MKIISHGAGLLSGESRHYRKRKHFRPPVNIFVFFPVSTVINERNVLS